MLTAMHRPIPITLVLSGLVHLALFLAIPLLFTLEVEPSVERTPLNVHVVMRPLDDDSVVDVSDDSGTDDHQLPIPPRPTDKKEALGSATKIADFAAIARTSAISTGALESGPDIPHAEAPEEGPEDLSLASDVPAENMQPQMTRAETVTTTGYSEEAAPPKRAAVAELVPQQVPMARRQRQMLTKRLTRWAHSFYKIQEPELQQTWEYRGQEYTATFRRPSVPDAMGIEHVIVEIRTDNDGETMSAKMRLKRLAFSSFAQLIDRWDPTVQIHDDELDGRFHSNSLIYVGHSRKVKPQFHGKVTTAARRVESADPNRPVRRKQIFLGGLETGVRKISLPKNFLAFSGDTGIGENQMRYFSEDVQITFYPDGTYGWKAAGSLEREQIGRLPNVPFYVVGAKNTTLYLRGIVDGNVLVYSPHKIIIEDDLIYAEFPDVDPDADDYLGLVSDKNIEIAPPDVTGPGDLLINASIYARRRFVVRRYRSRGNALLFIYGSVTAGSVSATEPRYRTKIQFDQRLEQVRPPNFPVTDRYEIESWDGQWHIDKTVPGLAF
jgi:hypothetical protein